MSIFQKLKERRARAQREAQLGDGLWKMAYFRYQRALDRYHQVIEGVTEVADYNALVLIGDELAERSSQLHQLCAYCQQHFPATDLQVPHAGRKVSAALSAAANALATTAEAAALVRVGQSSVEHVTFRAAKVHNHIQAAWKEIFDEQPAP